MQDMLGEGEEGEEGEEGDAGANEVVDIDGPEDGDGAGGTAVAIEDRITTPYMTKYERARILGTRALQIRCVAEHEFLAPPAPTCPAAYSARLSRCLALSAFGQHECARDGGVGG